LVDFGERIRVNGEMINRDYVVNFVEQSIDIFQAIQPSFFEATMSMAFNYFADQQVDIAIIEVGLGGRLDSTNVILPIISIITNISFDHMNLLGNTLAQIASEKAGIMKQNTPVVIGELQQETISVFREKANELGSPLFIADEEFQVVGYNGSKIIYTDKKLNKYKLGLTGNYQMKNLATVLKTIKIINESDNIPFQISKEALDEGLENVVENTGLKGRWEVLLNQPLTIADTGHNVAGIEFVVSQLAEIKHNKLHFVIGMVNDKDITHVLELLLPKAEYYFTQANIARALAATELQELAKYYSLSGNAFQTVEKAVRAAQFNAVADDIIFIGGSNFVVGEALILF
jgi:dihydrofolate synthase/folylpolyglutamate synthase